MLLSCAEEAELLCTDEALVPRFVWSSQLLLHAGLVQRCKGRYDFLNQGASLAGRTRRRTFEGADQPMEYEKDMRNRPAVLECLTCTLAAILNLSVLKANQVGFRPSVGLFVLGGSNAWQLFHLRVYSCAEHFHA